MISRYHLFKIRFLTEAKSLHTNAESSLIFVPDLMSHLQKSLRHSRSPKTQPLTGLVRLVTIVCKESTVSLSQLKSYWKSTLTEKKKQPKGIIEKLVDNSESSTCTSFHQVAHSCTLKELIFTINFRT